MPESRGNKHDNDWTPERVDLLKKLWIEDALSAGQIAAILGGGVSRSAVIGKVHRLKLQRSTAPRRTAPSHVPAASRPVPVAERSLSLASKRRTGGMAAPMTVEGGSPIPVEADTEALVGPAWSPLPGSSPVPLLDLMPGQCRWPHGDDKPFLFCGLPVHGDKAAYCQTHGRRAYHGVPGRVRAYA